MKSTIFVMLTLVFAAFMSPLSVSAEFNTGFFSNVAVDGYDVVAYFTEGKPRKGSSKLSTEWGGAEWRFASAKNLKVFKKNPGKYVPQFGGYCAWAVAQGSKANGDPKHWKIVNGKLYLNYNASILEKWEANESELIKQGNEKWPDLKDD